MPDPKTDVPGEAPPSVPARGYGPDPDFIEEAEDAACAEAEAAGDTRSTPRHAPEKAVEKPGKRNLER